MVKSITFAVTLALLAACTDTRFSSAPKQPNDTQNVAQTPAADAGGGGPGGISTADGGSTYLPGENSQDGNASSGTSTGTGSVSNTSTATGSGTSTSTSVVTTPTPSALSLSSCASQSLSASAVSVQCEGNKIAIGMGVVNRSANIDTLSCCSVVFSNGEEAKRGACETIVVTGTGEAAVCKDDQFFSGFVTDAQGRPNGARCCSLTGPANNVVTWGTKVVNPNATPIVRDKSILGEFGVQADGNVYRCPEGVMFGAGDRYAPDLSFDELFCRRLSSKVVLPK